MVEKKHLCLELCCVVPYSGYKNFIVNIMGDTHLQSYSHWNLKFKEVK